MKLEEQVASLELSKKLRDLGVKQESAFYWWEDRYGPGTGHQLQDRKPRNPKNGWMSSSAFTVAELGEMLPNKFGHKDYLYLLSCEKFCEFDSGSRYLVLYDPVPPDNWPDQVALEQFAATEADARAKMLIYLIEGCIVKP